LGKRNASAIGAGGAVRPRPHGACPDIIRVPLSPDQGVTVGAFFGLQSY
jgi:hypothetical protein